jgi:hypothetical protein
MRSWWSLLGSALWLAAGAATASSCVRQSPPDTFACDTASDCVDGEKCVDATCRASAWCTLDGHCASGQICGGETCVSPQCRTNDAAACGTFACRAGRCLEACAEVSDCDSGYVCEAGDCARAPLTENGESCEDDDECASGACCEDERGATCADECSNTGQACEAGDECTSGVCCRSTDEESGTCSDEACPEPPAPECERRADCAQGQRCADGRCVALYEPGQACTSPALCLSDSCDDGVCRGRASIGDECERDVACAAKLFCCADEAQAPKRSCGAPGLSCRRPVGDYCRYDYDCGTNNCLEQTFCTRPCATSADCGTRGEGLHNVCVYNGRGILQCFPGCKSQTDCDSAALTPLKCIEGATADERFCAAD